MMDWKSLTFLGDTVMLLPAAAALAAWLAVQGRLRLALAWTLLLGGGLAIVLASKVAFAGWGIGIRALEFSGFSGHAMRACAILPVWASLLARPLANVPRRLLAACGWLAGLLVALSRVLVGAHSPSEAMAGALLGAAVALGFLLAARGAVLRAPLWLLAGGLLVLAPAWQAPPAPTDRWVEWLALQLSGRSAPVDRARWLADEHYLP